MTLRPLSIHFTGCLLLTFLCNPLLSQDLEQETQLSIGVDLHTPFKYTQGSAVYQQTGSRSRLGVYHYSRSGQEIQLSVCLVNERLESLDIPSQLNFELLTEQAVAAGLSFQQPWRFGTLSLSSAYNQDPSSRVHSIDLLTKFDQWESSTELRWEEDLFDPTLSREDQAYTLAFTTKRWLADQSFTYRTHDHLLGAGVTASLGSSEKSESTEAFHALLRPVHRSFFASYSMQIDGDRSILIAINRSVDSLNATIERHEETVGKILDRDYDLATLTLSYSDTHRTIGLSYDELKAEFGGYLLAGPFGDLLTQLSGARSFIRGNMDLKYFVLDVEQHFQLKPTFTLSAQIELYGGQGTLDYTSYVWQLFNPLQELVKRELTIDAFIASEIRLNARIELTDGMDLILTAGQFFPVYLDYDLEGTQPPSDSADDSLILSRQFSLSLNYTL